MLGAAFPAYAEEAVDVASKPRVPVDVRSVASRASLDFAEGNFSAAVRGYREIIKKYPDSLYGWSNLSVVYYQMKKLPEALYSAKKATEISPRDAFSWSLLGIIYYQMKEPVKATKALERAKQLDPANPKTRDYLSILYYERGFKKKAKQEMAKAKELGYQPSLGRSSDTSNMF